MNEKPILFSGSMVRAILDGRKTQTRRILKPQPYKLNGYGSLWFEPAFKELIYDNNPGQPALMARCPYGQPGDRLWVREQIRVFGRRTGTDGEAWEGGYTYAADNFQHIFIEGEQQHWEWLCDKWRNRGKNFGVPSIHMPRWASRITLEVCSVRVERVQEISDTGPQNDCTEEGVFHCGMKIPSYEQWSGCGFRSSEKYMFRELWDSINAKRGFGWNTNPWVWVIEFRRIRQMPEMQDRESGAGKFYARRLVEAEGLLK